MKTENNLETDKQNINADGLIGFVSREREAVKGALRILCSRGYISARQEKKIMKRHVNSFLKEGIVFSLPFTREKINWWYYLKKAKNELIKDFLWRVLKIKKKLADS